MEACKAILDLMARNGASEGVIAIVAGSNPESERVLRGLGMVRCDEASRTVWERPLQPPATTPI